MDKQQSQAIIQRLQDTYGLKVAQNGKYLTAGRCPACGEPEAYAKLENPYLLLCGRLNKCGAVHTAKELFPDLYGNWSDRYPVTDENPTAAADAYLTNMRGFSLIRVRGWYTQENYYDRDLKAGSATVRFVLPNGAQWERLIDRPERFGKKKAHFRKGQSYQGQWWAPPGIDLTIQDEIWIVEGIFDAIALLHNDVITCSSMSTNNYPSKALEDLAKACEAAKKHRPKLVWAYDGDKAGQEFIAKHVEYAKKAGWTCEAAIIPQTKKRKCDWNEAHQEGLLGSENLKNYRYHGALIICKSPFERAQLMWSRRNTRMFHFFHNTRLYWFQYDDEKYVKAMRTIDEQLENGDIRPDYEEEGGFESWKKGEALRRSGSVVEIANCAFSALYYQANYITDESWYYFKVEFPHRREPVKNTFTGSQIAAGAEFKKRLLGIAPGAIFTGTTDQLNQILKEQTEGIEEVETIDFVGYSKAHSAYVFEDLAISNGRLYPLNEQDYFELDKLSIKTLNKSVELSINPKVKEFDTSWIQALQTAFGAKGLVSLVFWFGSLFAEQIREQYKSFPFFELVGQAGAGKSTMLEFFWKLYGRSNYEGFDPNKATVAARARYFGQVSNMPVVLIESDREEQDSAHAKQFDWDELKTAYNGRSIRSRGVKNNGNETYDPPFRGAIVISQNNRIDASEAILTRIVHCFVTREGQTSQTKAAAELLERMPIEHVSQFVLMAAQAEHQVMTCLAENLEKYELILSADPDVRTIRIIKNHALMLALLDALQKVVSIDERFVAAGINEIMAMARERQRSINNDHPTVAQFWETVEYLEDMGGICRVNHSATPDSEIAINLNHFAKVADQQRQQVAQIKELRKYLEASKSHKFIGYKTVRSAILSDEEPLTNTMTSKLLKCWVFSKNKGK